MIQDLSPPELDQASLEEILRWLAELFKSRFAFSVEYHIRSDGRLNRDSLQLCYRCIREMLMNSCKHSGRNNASVEVRIEERWMSITVTDEGVGFDLKSAPAVTRGRFGLTQLRERVREAGGSLSLASALGRGCRTTVRLPI